MRRTERRYSEEKISLARKRLDNLEEKCIGKTRDEAVFDLEKSIKKALEKGYTLKEISETLAEEEIFLPAGFLKAHLLKSPKKGAASKKTNPKNQTEHSQQKREKQAKEEKSSQELENNSTNQEEKPRTFNFVKPDRPDDEL